MHKGQVLSEEHKAKLLKANKGKILSEETKAKLRLAHLGKVNSEETRRKMSEARKDRSYPPEFGEEIKKRWRNPNYREKMKVACKGRIYPVEWGEQTKRRWKDPIYRERVINAMRKAQQNRRGEASIISKRMWQDLEFKDKIVRASRLAMSIHPNKPEMAIINMLESICPGEFKFVGDGQVIIAGKNPDFININGQKQIIELFGDYWHGKMARCSAETEKGRIKLFKQYGFDTLVIWERELKNPKKVMDRITNFTRRNCFERLLKE